MAKEMFSSVEPRKRKLFFVVNAFLPNEQAHGVQILHMCDAFTHSGQSVVLIVPCIEGRTAVDIQNFYSIPQTFEIEQIPAVTLPQWCSGRVSFLVRWFSFSLRVLLYLTQRGREGDIVYVRGEMILPTALISSKFVLCFETHIRPGSMRLYMWAMRKCALIITVTKAWAEELAENFAVPASRILVEPDAVDLSLFDIAVSKDVARRSLGLPLDKTILVYTGSDRPWKGLDVFQDAITQLDGRYLAVFVGNIKKKHKDDSRFLYKGFERHEMIPVWLAAADFLVLTGSGTALESQRYTSPLKLFEYMAARRPIIASDVPSFREILDDTSAFFISTAEGEEIAKQITRLAEQDAAKRVENAFVTVKKYTWSLRAERILANIT